MTLAKAEERLGTKSLLPQGWRWVRLGDICDMNPSRPAGFRRAPDALTTFVPMSAVDEHRGVILNAEIRPFSEVAKGYTFFSEGDILFAKITPCMQNGKQAIARGLIDGIGFGSTEFHVIRPLPGVASEWIHRFVRQPHVLGAAANHFTGAVGQQRVPESFLASLEIPLPSIDEQDRIMHVVNEQMTAVEKARTAAEAWLEAAKVLPAAYLRQVFPKPGKELPSGWRWARLEDLLHLNDSGIWGTQDLLDGLLVIRSVNFRNNGSISTENLAKIIPNTVNIQNKRLIGGDILLERSGGGPKQPVGRVALFTLDGKYYFGNFISRLRCKSNVDSNFLFLYLHSIYLNGVTIQLQDQTTGIRNLRFSEYLQLPIPLPPTLAEQERITAVLNERIGAVGKIVQTIQQELETINALPAALLRRAFTGGL